MVSEFISYRREDTRDFSGRLADRLRQKLGDDKVRFDVHSIRACEDYREVIRRHIAMSDVTLVVIGRCWVNDRLKDAEDLIRLEVAQALAEEPRMRVIPVLTDEAEKLELAILPSELQPLTKRNAVRFRHDAFERDAEHLISAIQSGSDSGEYAKRRAESLRRSTQPLVVAAAAALVIVIGFMGWEAYARRRAPPPKQPVSSFADVQADLAEQLGPLKGKGPRVLSRVYQGFHENGMMLWLRETNSFYLVRATDGAWREVRDAPYSSDPSLYNQQCVDAKENPPPNLHVPIGGGYRVWKQNKEELG